MPTDAVILVESRKEERNTPEYLIFVRGDKFESSWSLAKALEKFCGKNTWNFEMSYYAGIGPEEFGTKFADKLSKVNVLFARSPEELNMLKKRFGVSDDQVSESLLENDWVKPENPPLTPPTSAHVNINSDVYGNHYNDCEEKVLMRAWLVIFVIIIAAIVGGIYFLTILQVIKGARWIFGGLVKKRNNLLPHNQNRQGD